MYSEKKFKGDHFEKKKNKETCFHMFFKGDHELSRGRKAHKAKNMAIFDTIYPFRQ